MDADDVMVVVIQKCRSLGSFRKGFVWESGGFFDIEDIIAPIYTRANFIDHKTIGLYLAIRMIVEGES